VEWAQLPQQVAVELDLLSCAPVDAHSDTDASVAALLHERVIEGRTEAVCGLDAVAPHADLHHVGVALHLPRKLQDSALDQALIAVAHPAALRDVGDERPSENEADFLFNVASTPEDEVRQPAFRVSHGAFLFSDLLSGSGIGLNTKQGLKPFQASRPFGGGAYEDLLKVSAAANSVEFGLDMTDQVFDFVVAHVTSPIVCG
jgi:hypothetical protein